jgi:tRNA pseudouridine32 synthase/23S rRNA pseudouridine746 synthase
MYDPCFTSFKQSIVRISLPERFTFPFYYQPHPLCILASEELQQKLIADASYYDFKENGKMMGVLLVRNKQGDIGYLSAYSGKLLIKDLNSKDNTSLTHFAPFVFDSSEPNSYFNFEQASINELNSQVEALESSMDLAVSQKKLSKILLQSDQETSAIQAQLVVKRKERKSLRSEAKHSLNEFDFEVLQERLAKESVIDKNSIKFLKQKWLDKINICQQEVDNKLNEITHIKNERKIRSVALQQYLFQQYRFLNNKGEESNLTELFENTSFHERYGVPPAGAGDCAAPKLLQYAFKKEMTPLALAEFWWGKPPKSAIRQHKNFYTACIGKCQPILRHMLSGMEIDDDPLLENNVASDALNVVYQDDFIAVVNKPSELLSVPGKSIKDSVYTRVKSLFPDATGPLIVHRLDMSTSGLMVIALTKEAYQHIQQQFIKRTVTKRYVALLDSSLCVKKQEVANKGDINLPLIVDFDDRPRQMVCFDTGKVAQTHWQHTTSISGQPENTVRVHLYPKTGRTHQLRVHCAHSLGLNMPIIGDDLYGKASIRLCLHAELLELKHPQTDKLLTFNVPADF